MMRSQDSTVARRCAITSVVRWRINSSSAVCTSVSLSASSAEVGFVEQQQRRVAQDRARDRDALALAAGQRHAALAELRLEAAGQAAQEFGGMGEIGGALDLGIAGVGPAEADVFARAGREHHRVLRHQRDARTHVDRIGRS